MEIVDTARNPSRPHCASHMSFAAGCPVCERAVANSLPYQVRPSKPVTRSYGFTDDLTEAKIRALSPSWTTRRGEDEDVSLSLMAIRFILRLVWPFSRIV